MQQFRPISLPSLSHIVERFRVLPFIQNDRFIYTDKNNTFTTEPAQAEVTITLKQILCRKSL